MAGIFEQLGTPVHTFDSEETITRGDTVALNTTTGKWKKAPCGEGGGLSMQTHEQISTGTDIFGTGYNGYRNWYKPSLANVGDRLAVDTGTCIVSNFDRFTGTVAINDYLYCIGSGILTNYTVAAAASGWSTSSQVAVAKALSAGTRVGGSGTASIRIQGLFVPRAALS